MTGGRGRGGWEKKRQRCGFERRRQWRRGRRRESGRERGVERRFGRRSEGWGRASLKESEQRRWA